MSSPVSTEYGLVDGVPGRDSSVTVFRGIPFAAAPVGSLRWAPPAPPIPWAGVRRADRFGPVSPQPMAPAIEALGLPMSEDCLYLNVWTGAAGSSERRPVFVWIYGGGFQEGSAADPAFDGENLARRGVVVVTFNYRLGTLGFLATPELSAESGHGASGNYGLLDCVAALRWVQDNIAGFGGDPERVTIAGQSAGAGTVNFLTMSPLAKGLFQRSVAQSHARFSRDPELRYLATSYRDLSQAELGGDRFLREQVAAGRRLSLDELRALPWKTLVLDRPVADLAVETGSDARPPMFRPVVDGWLLPDGYHRTYARGAQNDVAYLAGSNLDESGAVPEAMFGSYRGPGPRPWRPGMPPVQVTLDEYTRASRERFGPLGEEFLRLYPAASDDEAGRASSEAVRDNARVSTYLWGADWTRHASRPVYTYVWTHRSPLPGQPHRRASHGSEIAYVFDNLALRDLAWSEQDHAVAQVMSGYWANFIATGDPNGSGLPPWPRYSAESARVMEVGAAFGPMEVASPERMRFWQRFFQTQRAW